MKLMDRAVRLIARDLCKRLSDARLDRALDSLPPVYAREPGVQEDRQRPVRAAAFQVRARLYKSLGELVRDIDWYMGTAAREGAALVCFPEFFGLLPAGISPFIRWFLQNSPPIFEDAENASAPPAAFNAAVLAEPFAFLEERYKSLMARFARRYRVWLSCGTVPALDRGGLFNRHILLAPDGSLAGYTDKLHLTMEEQRLGFSAGRDMAVIDTPIGRLALTVCMDATYFESFKIAKKLGAGYVINPIADMARFDPFLALRGARTRTGETGIPVIKAALVSGPDFPLQFSGRAGICFPPDSGIASRETESSGCPAVLTLPLDRAALDAYQSELFCRTNPGFNRNYLKTLLDEPEKFEGRI